MTTIKIFDTTLRDGTQMEGFSLGTMDKITVTKTLDDLGIDYIEGGWPASNPRDAAFFDAMKNIPLQKAKLCSFGATYHKKFKDPSECPSLQKTIECGAPVACIFGKTWKLHTRDFLNITPEENYEIIKKSVQFLSENGLEVIFDAEHFFDGFLDDSDFAFKCLQAALDGGVSSITLCDTNGGMLPLQVTEIVRSVIKKIPQISIGIHAHNDGDLAVANTLAAIDAGATLVQGTINGVGERCGNANLCSVIANLELKTEYKTIGKENLKKLKKASIITGVKGNYDIPKNLPFVGKSAFTHKGGIHVSAVSKNPISYECIDPASVGNQRRITISDLSGRSNLIAYATKKGYDVESFGDSFWKTVLSALKTKEENGLNFEEAGASFDLFFKSFLPEQKPPFILQNFFVHTSKIQTTQTPVEATVFGSIGDKPFHTAGWGHGPVEALDSALRKGLENDFPLIKNIKLRDFKVRMVSTSLGTNTKTRVVIEHTNGEDTWNTTGVSENIIDASMTALVDGLLWFLDEQNQ